MDPTLDALEEQHEILSGLIDDLDDVGWRRPTRCEGWDVADVVLHLAQTDELALGSVTGRYAEVLAELADGLAPATTADEGAAAMVARERGQGPDAIRARWAFSAAALLAAFEGTDLHSRVRWLMGDLTARTLATTRLAETWIHAGDVAEALGVTLEPTDSLQQIARLAWRTLPYAFASVGRSLAGPVAFLLTAPNGSRWDLAPAEPAVTTISGPATDLCAVAARRVDPAATTLHGDGPDAESVLALVRTYA